MCLRQTRIRLFCAALAAAAFALVSLPGAARAAEDPGRYKIHVVTFGPGEELFTRFGHIGLVVDDRERATRVVYNFGTFDFANPDLRLKYVRGFLTYWLSIASYRNLVRVYRLEDRTIELRTLALSPKAAEEVARRLEVNARPENREYQYRHYLDNCCTRIRDIVDDATAGALSKRFRTDPTGRTYRDWTERALAGMPLYGTVILYSLGPAIDQPITRWDEEFLPSVLSEDLDATILPNGRPLVEKFEVVSARGGPPVDASIAPVELWSVGAFALLLAVGFLVPLALPKRAVAERALGLGLLVYGLVAGLGGLMLLLYWTATTHYDTHGNENLFLTPPTHLLLVGPGLKLLFRGKLGPFTAKLCERYLIAACALVTLAALLKLGPCIQQNWGVVAFAAVSDLALLAALVRRHR